MVFLSTNRHLGRTEGKQYGGKYSDKQLVQVGPKDFMYAETSPIFLTVISTALGFIPFRWDIGKHSGPPLPPGRSAAC